MCPPARYLNARHQSVFASMDARVLRWITTKGGSALEERGADDKHLWVRCAKGHEWCAYKRNLAYSRSWCPECYGNKPHTIEMMQRLAEGRGGKCLSTEYHGLKTKLRWVCAYDHEWEATPNNVKDHGSWCPQCRMNVGEELVRATLEEAFPGKLFERTRREPWMEGLELDGYNEELRLAFEYQGKQHYERVEHFQLTEDDFNAQLERDALTEERCLDEQVALLLISHKIKHRDLREHVRQELVLLGYQIATCTDSDLDFYDRVRARGPSTARQYQRALQIIARKGGKCLSSRYVGYRVPLRILCGHGHEFEASLEAIDQPTYRGPRFCPQCGGTQCQTDDELRQRVESCGFALLHVESRHDTGGRSRRYITVQCPDMHVYEVLWDNFSPTNGTPRRGCAECHFVRLGKQKRTGATSWAQRTGIECVGEYQRNSVPCEWECPSGHRFASTLVSMQQKARDRKHPCTACELISLASTKGVRMVSSMEGYRPTTNLVWQCLSCHKRFEASHAVLSRKKTACPHCP